ncbi:MAG TPA: glycosyltransferase [Caldilineae bacterium]|nr:glycosyltransferase [Caldilineae bacterium]
MNKAEIRFSVVIPTYNRWAQLRCSLTAVLRQTYSNYEVIVVDDGSTDNTGEMIQRVFPQVRYVRQDANRGPAAARNRGIAAASGEIVAFTDDDCVVPPEWLAKISHGFHRWPDVAGVGGYQEAPDDLLRTNKVAFAEHVMRLRRWGKQAQVEQLGGDEVPGLGTNNVAYRRDVLIEVGGFDETFPVAAGEDADLKLRIAQRGYRLLYLPLKVCHYREYTIQAQWQMHWRRGVGAYYFEAKHGKAPGMGRILFRFLKRTLLFMSDLWTLPWQVAGIIYLSRVADCLGQLQAARGRMGEKARRRRARGET